MALRLSTGLLNRMCGTGGVKSLLDGGVIDIFTGSQPTDADQTETGSKLVRISQASGTTGMSFGTAGLGKISKDSAVWSGLIGTAGVAGWFRFYDSSKATGSNGTTVRFDGSVGVSGSDIVLGNTTLALNATLTIDTFTITLPSS